MPDLASIMEPLLTVRTKLCETFMILHRQLLAIVRDDRLADG